MWSWLLADGVRRYGSRLVTGLARWMRVDRARRLVSSSSGSCFLGRMARPAAKLRFRLRVAQGLAKLLIGLKKFADQRLQGVEPKFELRAAVVAHTLSWIRHVLFVHRYSGKDNRRSFGFANRIKRGLQSSG